MKGNGLISKTLAWITHPYYGNETLLEWAAGLAMVLVLSFLWSTVVRQIAE